MEQGRFLLAGEELEKEEQLEMKNKTEASAGRIRKENITAMAVEKRRRMREKYTIFYEYTKVAIDYLAYEVV